MTTMNCFRSNTSNHHHTTTTSSPATSVVGGESSSTQQQQVPVVPTTTMIITNIELIRRRNKLVVEVDDDNIKNEKLLLTNRDDEDNDDDLVVKNHADPCCSSSKQQIDDNEPQRKGPLQPEQDQQQQQITLPLNNNDEQTSTAPLPLPHLEEPGTDTGNAALNAVVSELWSCLNEQKVQPCKSSSSSSSERNIRIAKEWNALGLIRMHMQANAEEAVKCFRQALHLYDIEVNSNGFTKKLHRSDSTTATTVTMTTSSSACSSSNSSVFVGPETTTTTCATPATADVAAAEEETPSPASTSATNHTFDIAITLNDLAFCYMRLKQHNQAYKTYQRAYKLFKECQIDDESKCIHMAATMRFLSLLSQESNSLLQTSNTNDAAATARPIASYI